MTDRIEQIFDGVPLMAIFRHQPADRVVTLANTAWDLGITAVEIPLQSEEDARGLRAVVEAGRPRGAVVGAGTVTDPSQVAVAQIAGAHFVVSPGFDPAVVRAARDTGMPIVPGVATPTEVQGALALGLTWLKAFPAAWLGVDWFRHIRGPFPQAQFIATGGMDASNARGFLDVGVRVVAVGSALEDPEQLPALADLLLRFGVSREAPDSQPAEKSHPDRV